MKVHFVTPYALDKNLGKAYNEAFQLIGDDDWLCINDYDTMFLTPDAPAIVTEYVKRFPETALFTCYTNRVHPCSTEQLLGEVIQDNSDIRLHIKTAERVKGNLYTVTQVHKNVSGMLMVMSKKQWKETPFVEDLKCLGVDTELSKTLRERGQAVQRMNGLYIFHIYRIMNGIRDKSHLI